ncbi:hypothetical protein [Streptomyces yangpuensis]|uniref:hypothetical protein n=1 Tax=Streptomyces yangpuensis TaxID=1648182 RepID=UPI0038243FDB
MSGQLRIEVEQLDEDFESLQRSVNTLREDLLLLDVENIYHPPADPAPPNTRSAAADLVNVLVVTLPAVTPLLERVLHVVKDWQSRPEMPHSVFIEIGNKRIKLSNADAAQQRQLIDAFLGACAAPHRDEVGS